MMWYWHILSKIEAVILKQLFQIQISPFYQFGTLLTPIMDNNERIQTSSIYISAFEAFLAKQSAENNFQEGAASSPHGIIMSSGDTSQSKQPSSRC